MLRHRVEAALEMLNAGKEPARAAASSHHLQTQVPSVEQNKRSKRKERHGSYLRRQMLEFYYYELQQMVGEAS